MLTTLENPTAVNTAEAKLAPQDAAKRRVHQQRLVGVLRGVVEGLDLRAAELHLLNEASDELGVAADFGDGPSLPPRPLEFARADVAAMAGGVVVMENEDEACEWRAPAPCRSAVCVPVASDTTIHGTLWLYGAHPRDFEDHQLGLMEIVAGRLAVEIERRALLDARELRRRKPR